MAATDLGPGGHAVQPNPPAAISLPVQTLDMGDRHQGIAVDADEIRRQLPLQIL